MEIAVEAQIAIYLAIFAGLGGIFWRQSKSNERIAIVEQAVKSVSEMDQNIKDVKDDVKGINDRLDIFIKNEIDALKAIANNNK